MEISVFALPVLLAGVFISSGDRILLTFLVCFVFGGTATLSLTALGGAPILPAVLFLPFVVWRVLKEKAFKNRLSQLSYPNAGFWLVLLVMYEAFSAYVYPRLFQGETFVYMANRGAFNGVRLLPLKPSSTNLTQSFYSILGLITFFATSQLLNSNERLISFRNSLLIITFLDILAALIQFGESYLGLPPILAELRNANYAMFANYEEGGLMRIQGTFPEASAFSAFTLPLFAFCFSLFRYNAVAAYSGSLAFILLLILLLSTSTTTYFSLGIYLICFVFILLGDALSFSTQLRMGKLAVICWLLLVLVCIVLLVSPEIVSSVVNFFDLTLFHKLESSSGKERGAWITQGLINFSDTYGFGVGFGSNRCSNFFIALISSIGFIGAGLFAVFMWKIAASQTDGLSVPEAQVIHAAKHALLISIFSLFASAPFAEPGMMFYVFAAVSVAGFNLNVSKMSSNAPSLSWGCSSKAGQVMT
jgi:hypothetical protein